MLLILLLCLLAGSQCAKVLIPVGYHAPAKNCTECQIDGLNCFPNFTNPVYIVPTTICYNTGLFVRPGRNLVTYFDYDMLDEYSDLCFQRNIWYSYCKNATCTSTTMCSNNMTAKREYVHVQFIIDDQVLMGVCLPLLFLSTVFCAVLVCLRKNYFPLKGRNLNSIIGQMVVGFLLLATNALYPVMPCGLYRALLSTTAPAFVFFFVTRMSQLFTSFYLNDAREKFSKNKSLRNRLWRIQAFHQWFNFGLAVVTLAAYVINYVVHAAVYDFFVTANPCRSISSHTYTTYALMVINVVVAYVLCFASIRFKDPYWIRFELFVTLTVYLLLFAVIILYYIAVTTVGAVSYISVLPPFLAIMVNNFMVAIVPVIRTFFYGKPATEQELSDLNTWLNDGNKRAIFTEYCKVEYAIENILFYEQYVKFKTITDSAQQLAFIKDIYETYLGPHSVLELNVNVNTKNSITKIIKDESITANSLDALGSEIMFLMRDTFKRFVKSDLYLNEMKNTQIQHAINT